MDYKFNPSDSAHHKAPRTVSLPDFLSEQQLNQAMLCRSAKEIKEKVTEPNLEEINRKLGQENDPMYLAYACEAVFRRAGIWR